MVAAQRGSKRNNQNNLGGIYMEHPLAHDPVENTNCGTYFFGQEPKMGWSPVEFKEIGLPICTHICLYILPTGSASQIPLARRPHPPPPSSQGPLDRRPPTTQAPSLAHSPPGRLTGH